MHMCVREWNLRLETYASSWIVGSCIFAFITGDNVEFNLRADHSLHELVKDWLLGSTVPASVN